MTKHLARIFLLLSAAFLLAYYLPFAWHVLTARRARVPFVQYSDTGHGFLFTRYNISPETRDVSIRYTDAAGRAYERDAFEQMLPLTYFMQLEKNGAMPKTINGVKITPSAIRREMWSLRVRPDSLDTPAVPLYTVFETDSGRARLEMPDDYMRIHKNGRVEFLSPKTNKVLPEKSALYTEAFANAQFAFPVTALGSKPNPRKSYDEGIYIADANGQLFRLLQAKGMPRLARIADTAADPDAWRALRPRHIIINEIETRELRAFIIDDTGQPWLVTGKDYRLIKLPVTNYNPTTDSLAIRANLLSRLVLLQKEDSLEAVALDRNYTVLDRHEEKIESRDQQPAAKIAKILFPLRWWLVDSDSGYFGFYTKTGAACSLALNAILLLGYIIFLKLRRHNLRAQLPEYALIAIGGLCGLIAALLVPRVE
ncbi:hypothetical protein M2103_001781 [Ereboglobus sp. PH5-5]|uniref:DUF4857 domain-containing protein n=1 Tax=Ereboglobus sp. PH5-5 TaxID=2940529 RepID=UPI002406C78D|nr:DUF4857 domain-containing protein [Ereboglobus sp. PH5-5]MDF9833554.1 hypothetical protein [Ereboglobus sp. PH5-5]